MSLLAFGLVAVLAASAHRRTSAEASAPIDGDVVQAPVVLPAEPASEPPASPKHETGTAATSAAIAAPPRDRETRSVAIEDLFEGLSHSPACETYGTAIRFSSRPAEAARKAKQEGKLLFLLHLSGNFEDAKFT
jgi:hypothetical protein